jgi:four helix bundle protein
MNFQEWQETVPSDITQDPLWKLDVYRMALFASEIGWQDVTTLHKNQLTRDLSSQLIRALDSISANIAEGYSRSTGKDRARFMEYALGSARESRDWYYKAKRVLREEVIDHRINLLTQIVKILSVLVPTQRKKGIREEQPEYNTISDSLDLNTEVPTP